MSALRCAERRDLAFEPARDSARAPTAPSGAVAIVTRNSRTSSHASIATVPTRNSTLPTQASAVSAAMRWISPMSLLMRDMMSPSRVRA